MQKTQSASVINIAVLVSGSGSNLQSLIDTWSLQPKHARIRLVLSNRPGVLALERAARANIESCIVDHTHYNNSLEFNAAMDAQLQAANIDLIVLAGFMRILTKEFLDKWAGRVINIHPSLLPAYRGLHTHARAIADRQTQHGCSIHWVVPELDAGPLISQTSLTISPEDTAETLQKRVQGLEHKLYPLTLNWVLNQVELPHQNTVCANSGLMELDEQALQKAYDAWKSQPTLRPEKAKKTDS